MDKQKHLGSLSSEEFEEAYIKYACDEVTHNTMTRGEFAKLLETDKKFADRFINKGLDDTSNYSHNNEGKTMFKPGSKYIHFTKYGSVNKGEVKSYNCHRVIDTKNLVTYNSPYIITTKGIVLNLDGSDGKIYEVDGEITVERAKRINESLTNVIEKKIND